MKKNKQSLLYLRLFRPILHYFLIILSFYIIYKLRFNHEFLNLFIKLKIPFINFQENAIFALLSALVFLFIGFINQIYELFKPIHSYYKNFLKTWITYIIVTSFVAYFGYGYIFQDGISRFILLGSSITILVLITFFDFFRNFLNTYLEKKNPYKILIIYSKLKFLHKIQKNLQFYQIYHIEAFPQEDYCIDLLQKYQTDIIITVGNFEKDLLQEIVDEARIQGVKFYHITQSYFLDDLIYTSERLGPILALELKPSPLEGRYRVIKRLADLFFATISIVLLFPLLVLIGILIKINSKGPIFYFQSRVGKNGRLINFVKFRTMYIEMCVGEKYGGTHAAQFYNQLINSDANTRRNSPLAKIENDPRITQVGRFLRKTSLDELPQLWLILKGDMSFVGPRAHLPDEIAKYSGWQKRLLSIKPGLTGYSQLFGRDQVDFDQEAKLDLYYIQHRNILLDIYIVVTTVKVIFSGR